MTRNHRAAAKLVLPGHLPTHRGFRDISGERHGRLTVTGYAATVRRGALRHFWFCDCDCGQWAAAETTAIVSGRTTSCGCALSEAVTTRNVDGTDHGEGHGTPEYQTWCRIKTRCSNPNVEKYPLYGGRGITVCERWASSFPNFLADMGRRPEGKTSIDRIDPNGNYEPGNCRWADADEQNSNRRPSSEWSNSREVSL